ncbi:MAG: type II toxin-antitoxin system HicB family antitoxin [Gallionellaceae bacterium]
MQYPALFKPAPEGGFVVTFRDIPEAITQGDTEAEAMDMAEDVLYSAMEFYFDQKRPVPLPSAVKRGECLVDLPPSVGAKVLLLNEMIVQQITPSELARRLNTRPQDVNRVINLRHSTKIDTLGEAMRAMGKRLEVRAV